MNKPALLGIDRRTVLILAPLAMAPAVALAAPQAPEAETPILALFREWRTVHDTLNAPGAAMTDEEADAEADRLLAIEEAMIALPSTSTADMAAKLYAYTSGGAMCPGDGIIAECRALLTGRL